MLELSNLIINAIIEGAKMWFLGAYLLDWSIMWNDSINIYRMYNVERGDPQLV